MILRSYEVEEIEYRPNTYRVVSILGEQKDVLMACLTWQVAQAAAVALERARYHILTDNGLHEPPHSNQGEAIDHPLCSHNDRED